MNNNHQNKSMPKEQHSTISGMVASIHLGKLCHISYENMNGNVQFELEAIHIPNFRNELI